MISKEVFKEIQALRRSGKSIREIAKQLGLHRATATKYLAGTEFPRCRKTGRKDSILALYEQSKAMSS